MILCNYKFSITVPQTIKKLSTAWPDGLEIIDNFITEKEENFILEYLNEHWSGSSKNFTSLNL